MSELKVNMWGSVHPDAPMRVVLYQTFKSFGKLPRSSDKQTVPLSQVPGKKVVFISHRWLRPWHNPQDCEANGHEWAGQCGIRPSPFFSCILPVYSDSLAASRDGASRRC